MCVEFYLILKAFGAKMDLLWKMIAYSVWMLVFGYLGETAFRDQSAIWGAVSTIGYIEFFTRYGLDHPKLSQGSNDPILQKAFNTLAWFIFAGWAIYPIGYMTNSY